MTSSRSISLLALGALMLVLVAGCSIEETLPLPRCADAGSGLIVAQSVPDAELVPCLGPLPAGWSVGRVHVDQSGTDIWLDSDRAGSGAAVLRYATACDLGDAVDVPSDQPGASRFELIERVTPGFRGERSYTFPGGCVWWRFDFDDGAPAGLSVQLDNTLTLIRRSDINEELRETFIDEEL